MRSLLLIAELIAFAPGDVNDADADSHRWKNQNQDSGTKGVYEAMTALSCLCDAERTTLGRGERRQNEHRQNDEGQGEKFKSSQAVHGDDPTARLWPIYRNCSRER